MTTTQYCKRTEGRRGKGREGEGGRGGRGREKGEGRGEEEGEREVKGKGWRRRGCRWVCGWAGRHRQMEQSALSSNGANDHFQIIKQNPLSKT